MYAALKTSRTTPFDGDLLSNSVRNGAMTSTTALRCTVGSGSSAQLLLGNTRTAVMTSSTVTSWNWQIEVCRDVVDVNDGGWASAGAARTLANLSSK